MKVKVCGFYEDIKTNEINFIHYSIPFDKANSTDFSCTSSNKVLDEDNNYIFFCMQCSPKCAFSRIRELK